MRDTLLPDEGGGGAYYSARPPTRASAGFSLNAPTNAFDPFRNFQQEATSSSKGKSKADRLAEMFQPPTDLICPLPLDAASRYGASSGKWVLVNIQKATEFGCQVLNRDVWRDPVVRSIVQEKFLLWQQQHTTTEAVRYIRDYEVDGFPHLAILDPATGARVHNFPRIQTVEGFQDQVLAFLDKTKPLAPETGAGGQAGAFGGGGGAGPVDFGEDDALAAAIRASIEQQSNPAFERRGIGGSSRAGVAQGRRQSSSGRNSTNPVTIDSDGDASDQEFYSASENDDDSDSGDGGGSASDDVQEVAADADARQAPKASSGGKAAAEGLGAWPSAAVPATADAAAEATDAGAPPPIQAEEPPKDCAEPVAQIRFILPDNARVQRRFYARETVRKLINFIGSHGYASDKFRLVTSFPQKDLATLDPSTTLSDCRMVRETIRVEPIK